MSVVIVRPENDGPYYVKGAFKIVTPGGKELDAGGDETWLCRCGASATKPFCDGSHKRIGFKCDPEQG